MAEEPWNRVNIPFPSAISSIRIPFSSTTDTTIKHIIEENDKVRMLLESGLLQTDIRVLYELLYLLNNSLRQHKPLRVIKQVEQCINRLKEMKLDAALLDLGELCPKKVQRQLGIKVGQCEVPSQPMLEWFCLKALGAASLMRCVLHHCTRAFILIRQHLHWGEFIVLNVVLASMVSRLRVFFQGILVSLAPLYQRVLELLREVSQAQPMPYLQDFTLPADMTEFLGAPDSPLLKIEPSGAPKVGIRGISRPALLTRLFKDVSGEQKKQPDVKPAAIRKSGRRLDLGKAVSVRKIGDSVVPGFDVKALLKRAQGGIDDNLVVEKEPSFPLDAVTLGQKRKFVKQVKAAATFRDMAAGLEESMRWCKRQKLKQERGRLAFLHLRCQQMKHLEAAGHRVQRKLRRYKQEVSWALTLRRAGPRTCQPLKTLWRRAHPRTRFQPLRTKVQTVRSGVCLNRKQSKRHRKRTDLLSFTDPLEDVSRGNDMSSTSISEQAPEASVQNPSSVNKDDIDDIFASLDF